MSGFMFAVGVVCLGAGIGTLIALGGPSDLQAVPPFFGGMATAFFVVSIVLKD